MKHKAKEIVLKVFYAMKRCPVRAFLVTLLFALTMFGNLSTFEWIDQKLVSLVGYNWPSVIASSPFFKIAMIAVALLFLWQIGLSAKDEERAAAASEREAIIQALAPMRADIERYNRLRDIDRAKVHLAACARAVELAGNNLDLLEGQGQLEFGFTRELEWNDTWGTAVQRGRLEAVSKGVERLRYM